MRSVEASANDSVAIFTEICYCLKQIPEVVSLEFEDGSFDAAERRATTRQHHIGVFRAHGGVSP
jgi:hypothetical protein